MRRSVRTSAGLRPGDRKECQRELDQRRALNKTIAQLAVAAFAVFSRGSRSTQAQQRGSWHEREPASGRTASEAHVARAHLLSAEKTAIRKAIGEGIICLHTSEKMIAATDDNPGKNQGGRALHRSQGRKATLRSRPVGASDIRNVHEASLNRSGYTGESYVGSQLPAEKLRPRPGATAGREAPLHPSGVFRK